MHSMDKRKVFRKFIHSMFEEILIDIVERQEHIFSRNARFQADYGLFYMTTIVKTSQGMNVDEETDKLIVNTIFAK